MQTIFFVAAISFVTVTEDGGGDTAGIVAAVVIPVVLVAVFIAIVVWYLRRKGKFRHKSGACFEPLRKRRGSTTDSRRGLEDELDPDKPADLHDDHPGDKGQEDQDMFTIDEFEDDADRRDEYYYDEVFGRSEFEDEVTKNSVRQLYSTADEQKEEELLDLDFETLGIKIGDSPINSSTRHINF
ncbi:hypothetical protein PoB_002461000 [Plakobranchus ocellatus]|uniref:Neurofascin/L1/NrCAM C-terminal domain-containing protein n=1 Tax=Plakobranchus ocellatus TaxID=259542 RepID=A0AAV3ZQU6_9GAST|nr:hypothetical protein PoB_002461000 [Plakobranchus ocellatus]